jgi:hypothetical protein
LRTFQPLELSMARHLDHRVWLLLLALAVALTVACSSSSSSTGNDGTDGATESAAGAMTQG